MAEVNLNEPVDAARAQRAGTQTLLAGQDAMTGGFLDRFKGTLGSQEKTSAMATRLGQELGLPQLRSNATMLRNTMTNLPGTYSAATRGFDVNQNQLNRIVGTESSKLAPAMETAERSLSDAENTLSTRMGFEQRDQDRELIPFNVEQDFMVDRMARETTLFTADNGRELDALLAKMSAGITLSEGEKNRANQLAMQEKEFENTKKLYAEQAKYSAASDPYVSLGEGSTLYNTSSGKAVYTAPKTYAPSSGGDEWS